MKWQIINSLGFLASFLATQAFMLYAPIDAPVRPAYVLIGGVLYAILSPVGFAFKALMKRDTNNRALCYVIIAIAANVVGMIIIFSIFVPAIITA